MPTDHLSIFAVIFSITEFTGIILFLFVLSWVTYFRGGFSWRSNVKKEFNWHPLLMTFSFSFLFANGILVYRTYRYNRKKHLKIFHAIINIIAFAFGAVGLQAVFDSHNLAEPPIPNLYTLHSWFGITTVTLFVCQWITGFVTFLYPGLKPIVRRMYLPFHVYCGLFTFIFACITCLLGVTEKTLWAIKNYKDFPAEGIIVNVIGCLFILFTSLTVFLVLNIKYKRYPIPEDDALLQPKEAHQKAPIKSNIKKMFRAKKRLGK